MTESFKNELYHHGVKGMKWGQHIFGKRESKVGNDAWVKKKQDKYIKKHKQPDNMDGYAGHLWRSDYSKYNDKLYKKAYPIKRREAAEALNDLLNKHDEYVNTKEFKKQQRIFNKYEDRYAKKIDKLYKKANADTIEALNEKIINNTVKDRARILRLNSKDRRRYIKSDAAMTKATQMKSNAWHLKQYTKRHNKNRYYSPDMYRIVEEYKKKQKG